AAPWRHWIVHGAIGMELPDVFPVFCAMEPRMAQLKLEKEEFSPVFCAMAQRSCAWRN
ncbi:hypothetical protein L195_g061222, partial [Trifolium pratense]